MHVNVQPMSRQGYGASRKGVSTHVGHCWTFRFSPVRCGDEMRGRMPEQLLIADHALDERTHLIEVEGAVDLYSAPELQARTTRVIGERKTSVLIDLSRVIFIDSTGLSVLVDAL